MLEKDGAPVVDGGWSERLLDISTADKRRRLARVVAGWTSRCADDGLDAV